MGKKISKRQLWKVIGLVGAGLTLIGGAFSFFADPINMESEIEEIVDEKIKALQSSNEES